LPSYATKHFTVLTCLAKQQKKLKAASNFKLTNLLGGQLCDQSWND